MSQEKKGGTILDGKKKYRSKKTKRSALKGASTAHRTRTVLNPY